MSDEIKIETTNKCLCQSKGFRKFMIVAGGTFVGAFLALSLFAALHKPPVMAPMGCPCGCGCHHMRPYMGPHHFDKMNRGDRMDAHHRKMVKQRIDDRAPRPRNVEIDD